MEQMLTRRPTVPAAEEVLGCYFPVHQHGFVSLVDYMGCDEAVEQAARVSYGLGTRATTQTRGLLRYLKRHRHTTPSEMVELKFHISMPIFVARQMVRHRTASINEYSGRYSLMPMLFYTPAEHSFRAQAKDNKQGRSEQVLDQAYTDAVRRWNEQRAHAQHLYEDLAAADVARELARIDLPLSTYTQWYWKIDLHNLMHFLTLRADSHAQEEVRAYARVLAALMRRVAPLSFEAWVDYEHMGARFSRMEMVVLQRACTATLLRQLAQESGMQGRELEELTAKFQRGYVVPAEYQVELVGARTAEEVAAAVAAATPRVDAAAPST